MVPGHNAVCAVPGRDLRLELEHTHLGARPKVRHQIDVLAGRIRERFHLQAVFDGVGVNHLHIPDGHDLPDGNVVAVVGVQL